MPDAAADAPEVAVCVAGESAWHAAAHAGLDVRWHTADGIAWAERPSHRFLLGAVTFEPRPRLPVGLRGAVCDSFAALDAMLPAGWQPAAADPWMYRAAGPIEVPEIEGVRVAATRDALLFERAAFIAASGVPPERPGELHPPGSEAVPGLHLLLAMRGAEPIGSALAVVHAIGVQVSAIAVIEAERGRGIGSALTAAAVRYGTGLPATLSASDAGASTYERLGFRRVGVTPLHWTSVDRP